MAGEVFAGRTRVTRPAQTVTPRGKRKTFQLSSVGDEGGGTVIPPSPSFCSLLRWCGREGSPGGKGERTNKGTTSKFYYGQPLKNRRNPRSSENTLPHLPFLHGVYTYGIRLGDDLGAYLGGKKILLKCHPHFSCIPPRLPRIFGDLFGW